MSILITGGAGFIGSNVCRFLLTEEEQIVVYDLPGTNRPIDVILSEGERERIKFVTGDVTDPLHLFSTLRELAIGRVVHLASLLTPGSQANPPGAVRINCQGTVNVFEAARTLGIGRVVWASSAQVFGPLDRYRATFGADAVSDDSPPYPDSIYGAAKLLLEHVARQYSVAHGLDVVGLRPPGIFGAGRREGATVYIVDALRAAISGRKARVRRGDWLIPLAYVEDVARAFAVVVRAAGRFRGETYNIPAVLTSAREIAGIVTELVPGAAVDVEACEQLPSARIEAPGLRREFGFEAKYGLRDGLAKTLAALASPPLS